MVASRCAMQSKVDSVNSFWMARCMVASVSTSTLEVASSCAKVECQVRTVKARSQKEYTRVR